MAGDNENRDELAAAIKLEHKCKPTYRETVFVHEKTNAGETVWRGYVEVFDITGHKKAKTCYAWRYVRGNEVKIFTVLASGLINSPRRAVQAAIFTDAQPLKTGFDKGLALIQDRVSETPKAPAKTAVKAEDSDVLNQAAENNLKTPKQKLNNGKKDKS